MKILITGSTGMLGETLVKKLSSSGDQVVRLTRGEGTAPCWNPARGTLDPAPLEGFDAVVHLAGEGIANQRWNAAVKSEIKESRVRGTRLLADTLSKLQKPPQVLISASAIGYYGDRGEEWMTEDCEPGTGFLPEVCRLWEDACRAAMVRKIRVVNLRIGIVLSTQGGALAKMLLPFQLGVGGKIGSGRQYMSWVTLEDVVGIIQHTLKTPSLSGPLNAVSPQPVTNAEFTKTLGRVLNRPTLFPLPAPMACLMLGEMAPELLLASTRVSSQKLTASGYGPKHISLELALRELIEKA